MSNEPTKYTTRSSAHRAARNACRKALNAPYYMAYEGPDYEIHPEGIFTPEHFGEDRWFFKLRGPALDALKGNE